MDTEPRAEEEPVPLTLLTEIPGLTLRELLPADTAAWIAHVARNRAHLAEFGEDTLPPHTPDTVSQWLTGNREVDLRLGIWLGEELIGFVGLSHLSHAIGGEALLHESPDGWVLGYGMSLDHVRKGYTTAACRSLIEHAHSELGAKEFWSSARTGNRAGIRVLERLGFSIYEEGSKSIGYRLKAE